MTTKRVLPSRWEWVDLQDLVQTPSSDIVDGPFGSNLKASEYKEAGIPIIRLQNIDRGAFVRKNIKFVSPEKARQLSRHNFQAGDIVITKLGDPLGEACLIPDDMPHGILVADVVRVRPREAGVNRSYLMWAINSEVVATQLRQATKGTTRPRVNLGHIRNLEMPLAPTQEQVRIAAAVETQFTRLDSAVTTLERVQANLKRYRASVLKAAVEGRLVPTEAELARREGRDYEPASVLLERILKERRRRWEETELSRMKGNGKLPKDDKWKAGYREPAKPDIATLPKLPAGWTWATWDQVSDWVTYGFTRPMPHMETGVPIVTAKNVMAARMDLSNTHKTTQAAFTSLSEKDRPKTGDLLITKDGTIGRACAVTDEGQFCINQSVAVAWTRGYPLNREYLICVIGCDASQKRMMSKKRGVAILHLSITDFARMPVPLPPLSEQDRIASDAALHFSLIEHAEAETSGAIQRVSRLRQSVLKWAFEGRLVDQDPADEPASALLDRIKAERESGDNERPASKPRGRSKKVPA